ncbi:MAG: GNAT family N-acetyltransferase [Candidatus Shapirobacteria bacterium]|jgi:beta-N-acetylhexosaminidase
MKINKFESGDFKQILYLWNQVLVDKWPIEKERLIDRVRNGFNFVAIENNRIVGFINGQYNGSKGQITLVMVDKNYQRKGVGMELLKVAKECLHKFGAKEVFIGCGAGDYFWPGVPTNLPDAISFFKKNGLKVEESNLDMAGNLENYQTPKEIMERIKDLNLVFTTLKVKEAGGLITFEKTCFPEWTKFFENAIREEHYENIFIVKDSEKILGSAMLLGEKGFVWSKLLNKAGGFGALGVAENQRDKGIGLALAAKATEVLKDRGVKNSFLGWTYLDKWYGKLGYKVWREYEYGGI